MSGCGNLQLEIQVNGYMITHRHDDEDPLEQSKDT